MAATQLVMIDDFLIDCSISENHTFESQVTEYPVESGSNISDNIRPMPITVEMECLVSNSPIGVMKDFRDTISAAPPGGGSGDDGTKPSVAIYEKLQVIRKNRKPVTIRTSIRTFERMVLKNLTIPRSGKSGDDLRFSATFQQIDTVENKRSIRVSTPIGNGKKKISKTPEPIQQRFIMLDIAHTEWFDPDFNQWRAYYVDPSRVNPNSNLTVLNVPLYRLYRGQFTTNFAPKDLTQTDAGLSIGGAHTGGSFRNIILVNFSKCETRGFTINWTPYNSAENDTTLKVREG